MPNYEVGDTVEEIRPDGTVKDTGVVTKIEEDRTDGVHEIWAMWEVEKGELHFSSTHTLFRIKTKRPSDHKITLETVRKILFKLASTDRFRGIYTGPQLEKLAEEIFQSLQADQQELQRQNDPEYQKYLELKKKFETT